MGWQVNTDSPIFKGMSPQQQQQLLNSPVPVQIQQQQAQLNETNAGAQSSGASAANSMSEVQARQQVLKQQQFIDSTQALFDKNKDKNGYVDPHLFNITKQAASSVGISSDGFDGVFGDKSGYVDPNKVINYNSAEGLANQQAYGLIKRQVQAQLDKYNQIPSDQKGLFSKAEVQNIPILGQLLAPAAVSYETARNGLSAQLKSIAGAGAGSGVKVSNAELDKWASLLPQATDRTEVAKKNIQTINDEMKATFNTPDGLDQKYFKSLNDILGQ